MPEGKNGAAKNWLSQLAGRPRSVQGRITPVGVPTPKMRSNISATTISKTGARMAVTEMDNHRQELRLGVGAASVICTFSGTVPIITVLGDRLG